MKKIRSSQPAIPVLNWVKHQSFPVSIVKVGSHSDIGRDKGDKRKSEISDKDGLRLNFECEPKHLIISLALVSSYLSP